MSKRTATVVLPGAKNMSRMTAARWNWTMSAGETGAGTPSAGWPFQGLPVVSTKGRSCVLKKPSIRPPGANSLAKSSSGVSSELPGTNGKRPFTASGQSAAGPLEPL